MRSRLEPHSMVPPASPRHGFPGKARARTGNIYQIEGGYGAHDPDAFVACGYILPKQPGEAPG